MKSRVFVSTFPFGTPNRKPLEVLQEANCDVLLNPFSRTIRPEEERELLVGVEGLIAGTERLDEWVLEKADQLRVIARVGVGLDGIDFNITRNKGIIVTFTPQAPALAVAELATGFILDLARRITYSDKQIRLGIWNKYLGHRLRDKTIGIVGVGRIGRRIAHILSGFGSRILGYDILPEKTISDMTGLQWVDRETILRESDFLTLHLPLTERTHHWINDESLSRMKPNAYLINTSRGNIVDEQALIHSLQTGALAGAAIDVYSHEPYHGPLCEMENVILSCHIGAATIESRFDMEIEAAMDCVRVLHGEQPEYPVLMIPS